MRLSRALREYISNYAMALTKFSGYLAPQKSTILDIKIQTGKMRNPPIPLVVSILE